MVMTLLPAVHAEYNDLTGIIPDNFDATSHLRVLTAWGNNLTGPIPSTLGLVPNMEVRASVWNCG